MPISTSVWTSFLDPLRERAQDWVSQDMRPGARLLEVGCGRGDWAARFQRAGFDVVGVDLDTRALDRARTQCPGEFLAAPAESLPFPDASFDAAVMCSVIAYTDRVAVMAEIARVLKPGGRLAMVENLAGNPTASAYRAWARARRQPVPEHMRWREIPALTGFFSASDAHAAHLLTPAVLAGALARRRGRLHQALEYREGRLFRGLRRLDRAALERWPGLGHLAWFAVIRAVR